MRSPRVPSVAIGIVILVVAAGCGGTGSTGATGTGGSPSQGSQAVGSSPASSGAGPTVLWPAPPDPMDRTVAAGLEPAPREYLVNHVHAHLDVFVDGQPIAVPAGIGINIEDPNVRHFNEPDGSVSYGGIEMCAEACISPLHTHDGSGILHTESSTPEPNTLGQFFTEWGVALSESCVGEFCSSQPIAIYVNGELVNGDPGAIELSNGKEIAIVIGTPPAVIPKSADFSGA